MTFRMAAFSCCLTIQLGGCCGASKAVVAYKAVVEKYSTTLAQRGSTAYACVAPELKKELVLNDASLACLVDKDHSKAETTACKCSDGKPDEWQANCADWLAGH